MINQSSEPFTQSQYSNADFIFIIKATHLVYWHSSFSFVSSLQLARSWPVALGSGPWPQHPGVASPQDRLVYCPGPHQAPLHLVTWNPPILKVMRIMIPSFRQQVLDKHSVDQERAVWSRSTLFAILHMHVSLSVKTTWAASWQKPTIWPSLIRVFAVRMKKAWVLRYPLSAVKMLIRLGRCPGWSEPSLGAVILFVLSWGGSYCSVQIFG